MAIELVCACGRVVRFDKPPVEGQARCPDCNAVLTIENDRSIMATITDMPVADHAPESPAAAPPGAARKPLWELMARHQNQPEIGEPPEFADPPGAATIEAPVDVPEEPPAEPPGAVTIEADYDDESEPARAAPKASGPASGRKGLWSVMQTSAAGAPESHDSPAKTPGACTDSKRIGPPGSPSSKSEIPNPKSENSSPPGSPIFKSEIRNPKSEISAAAAPQTAPPDSLASMIGITADEGLLSAQNKSAGHQAENSRRAVIAAALGGISIPLSGLALINSGWALPATAVGFVALLTGLIASQEIRRSGGHITGRRQATAGIVTGVIGVFLGPVIALLARPRKGQ